MLRIAPVTREIDVVRPGVVQPAGVALGLFCLPARAF